MIDEILEHYNEMIDATDMGWCIDLAVRASKKHDDLKFNGIILVTGEESQKRSERILFWMPYRRIEAWLNHIEFLLEQVNRIT